jgi:hypothetical protein
VQLRMHVKVTKSLDNRMVWKDQPEKVKALYMKSCDLLHGLLSTAEHVKFCWNLQGPTCKAKYFCRPIVYKYREGKVKSTPEGE